MREGNNGTILWGASIIYRRAFHPCSYWLINFFAGPQMLESVRSAMRLHPEVVRHTILKKADTLKHLIRP